MECYLGEFCGGGAFDTEVAIVPVISVPTGRRVVVRNINPANKCVTRVDDEDFSMVASPKTPTRSPGCGRIVDDKMTPGLL